MNATHDTDGDFEIGPPSVPDRMPTIPGEEILFRPILIPDHCKDLLWHDGPLVTVTYDLKSVMRIWHWCDCDSECHRWLVSRPSALGLSSISQAKFPPDVYRAVLTTHCLDEFVFFCDRNDQVERWSICPLTEIPETYLPGDPPTEKAKQ